MQICHPGSVSRKSRLGTLGRQMLLSLETLNEFRIRLTFLTLFRDTLPLQLTSLMTNTLPSRDLTWDLMAQIKPQKGQAWESGWCVQAQLRSGT